ncbi:type IV pilus assembly protein PilB [Motilibacter peucedani]|uniref:Type IV pilus assembly protein PilB n=1 Tax=Motilibacter peucedani TaxID=598650 RepID=A0A420XMD1_9ACTN|nr:GspE/PulE family protein [Motilibacter peucedani]RKS72470.1 type IV pilus assembly protein PilB [Motilibacter peucedani]
MSIPTARDESTLSRGRHAYSDLPYAVSSTPEPATQQPAAAPAASSSYAGANGYGGGTRKRIGDVLVEAGVLTQADLERALGAQKTDASGERKRLGEIITELGFASERQVAQALADVLGLQVVDLGAVVVSPEVARSLPRSVAERTGVLVVDRAPDGALRVATSDPTNVLALDDVRLYTNAPRLDVLVATSSQVREHLHRAWSLSEDNVVVADVLEGITPDTDDTQETGGSPDDAPTVRLVNMVLSDAVRAGASDIHIEPQRDVLRIRYRVDGMLRDVMTVPRRAAPAVVSRIKITSGLDIAERRVPQDGRARISVDGTSVDTRISTMPSIHGEKVVIRLLMGAEQIKQLDAMGMSAPQLAKIRASMQQPQGLVLITGPTGSGKTSTLYAALSEIVDPTRNIVTLEDPVEIQIPGITQTQTNERAGMTFAKGLRSILRQDPDVVLVGEVRDAETAELALTASMTGHLVLSTLHTNSAVAAITRMVDMGIEPFLVASSLTCVVAQRLVRRVCTSCARPEPLDPVLAESLGVPVELQAVAAPRKGEGCTQCGGTGYKGRCGIYEVIEITPTLRGVLLRDPSEAALARAAEAEGFRSLRSAALELAARGETTFAEVARVVPRFS